MEISLPLLVVGSREGVSYASPVSLRQLDQLLGTGDEERTSLHLAPRPATHRAPTLPPPAPQASTLLGLLLPADPVSPGQGRQ